MFTYLSLLTVLLACYTQAIQVKPSYGPPPPQRQPHREYGVPQQMPFREYGPPALKYGPPKLNFIGGSSSSGLHEQIKTYYGAPKPFYGPPHKPQQQYGPPPKPQQQYGPPPQPAPQYGPPPKPAATYGPPPQKFQHRPAASYGPPKPQYGPPPLPPPPHHNINHQLLMDHHPLDFKIYHPTGLPNYGPPPLPNFNGAPETTIIVTGSQNSQSQSQHHHQSHQQQQQQQQVQIQVDASGHTHSVVGSQAPFHTACDGWKPIPAPVGAYVENNHIDTQSGYSQVAQGSAHASAASSFSNTQYSNGISTGIGGTASGTTVLVSGSSGSGGNSIVNGISDEQLVALALQAGDNGEQKLQQEVLPSTAPAGDFNQHGLNSIDAEALQLSLGSSDDSYSKPPVDSYAPGSKYSHKFGQQSSSHSSFGITGPGGNFGNYGPPPPPPNGNYGPPPPPPSGNYGPPPPPPNGNFGLPPPPPPTGNYGPPPVNGAAAFVHHHAQSGLGIQYGKQSGNLGSFSAHGGAQPSKPVAFRPPVPQGLFESIGATFGVKPQIQAPTYIPPAANEIPQTGPGNLNIEYGVPQQQQQQQHQVPLNIIEQQLPQQPLSNLWYILPAQQSNHTTTTTEAHSFQQEFANAHAEYGVPPPPPPQGQGQGQFLPPPPPAQLQQQYLPPTGPQQQQFNSGASYSSSAAATFDSTAYAASQYSHDVIHSQALPLQQEQPRFHDCGHGPNLVGAGGFNYQQQQQQQQHQYSSGASTSIAQSIPVAEQHTQFVSGPGNSYGPPASGGNEIDHIGYASQKSQVTAFPDGTSPEGLPGLDGLNVLSAQKSEAIHFSSQQQSHNANTYQVQYGGNGEETANHEEILSAATIAEPFWILSDIDINDEPIEAEDEDEPGVAPQESKNVEVKVKPNDEKSVETAADVKEIKPIVVKEENEAKH
ncbi:hypothetical protein DOY81_010985 [Sarcophaga bullata]|nr:hypothetical protein DOY81_010985 [Sarcophaga bullata]